VKNLIDPALAAGKIVLCDRYYLSTAAYQGTSESVVQTIIERNQFAPVPDIAFILEMSVEESIRRITVHRGDLLNDFEQADSLRRVDSIFKSMNFPYIRRIDATGSIEHICQQVIAHTKAILNDHTTQVQS
jgi:dTMP kinase